MAFRCAVNYLTTRIPLFNKNVITNSKLQCAFYAPRPLVVKKKSFPTKKALIAVCCIGMSGGVYGYLTAAPDRKNRSYASSLVEVTGTTIIDNVPAIKPSRQVTGPATDLGLNFVLYQYQTCPFCCKVRAFLDYYGIPYDVVEVNPLMKQQVKFSKYKKVPFLIAHDQESDLKHQLNDSSAIISILGTFLYHAKDGLQNVLKYYVPVTYTNPEGKEVTEIMNQYFLMYGENVSLDRTDEDLRNERKWRKWADNELVHIISPNIYRTPKEAMQAFNHFSDVGEWEKNFSSFERFAVIYVGAAAMYLIGKKLKKKHSLKDDVRQSLYDSCRLWTKEIGENSKYMGGESPNLADLAVYGLLSSIEGCTTFQDLLANTTIGPWYFNVKKAVNDHNGYKTINMNKS